MTEEKKTKKKSSSNERFMPFLVVVIAVLAFAVGILWQKVSDLESGGSNPSRVANVPTQPQEPEIAPLEEAKAEKLPKVSVIGENEIETNVGSNVKEAVSGDDYIKGSRDAEVFIIEYSDYECPYCSRFHPTAQQAVDEYDGQVAWVYRHFPLDTIHPKARPAAIAAECVGTLGGNDAFWEFTDYLFENQQTALSDLEESALESTGLNIASCLEAGDDTQVEADYQNGLGAGVNGTPGNFVMNRKGEVWVLPGAVPFSTLQDAIEKALGN